MHFRAHAWARQCCVRLSPSQSSGNFLEAHPLLHVRVPAGLEEVHEGGWPVLAHRWSNPVLHLPQKRNKKRDASTCNLYLVSVSNLLQKREKKRDVFTYIFNICVHEPYYGTSSACPECTVVEYVVLQRCHRSFFSRLVRAAQGPFLTACSGEVPCSISHFQG